MHIDWRAFREFVDRHEHFAITSHVRPDADAIGSETGLAEVLRLLGKKTTIVNASPTPRRLEFLDPDSIVRQLGVSVTPADLQICDAFVVVDTSAWGQLGEVAAVFKSSPAEKAVIDHHVSSDDLGAQLFKDVQAEATGRLIYDFAVFCGVPMSAKLAGILFCAIATDTGWFRFPSTNNGTFEVVSKLMEAGVRPGDYYQKLYENQPLGRLKLAGRVLSRIEPIPELRIAHTYARLSDFSETKTEPSDTEDMVNECLKILDIEGAFIAIEQSNGNVKVSFRSRVGLDVATIAEKFGGGGHLQAAGAILPGPLETVQSRVIEAFKNSRPA